MVMTRQQVFDASFLDCRCMILELAAALDRLDAAPGELTDPRHRQLQEALRIVLESPAGGGRAARILRLLSVE